MGADSAEPKPEVARHATKRGGRSSGVSQARLATAAAARACPLAPKKIVSQEAEGGQLAAMLDVSDEHGPAPLATASLAKCGYYFEDPGADIIKVTVPLVEACGGRAAKGGGGARDLQRDHLQARRDARQHGAPARRRRAVLRIDAKASVTRRASRPRTQHELKLDPTKKWKKLTAL